MRDESMVLKIRGMICRSCVGEVEELLCHTRGVIHAKVSYAKGQAQIEYDPDIVSPEELQARLRDGGYASGERGLGGLAGDCLCLVLTGLLAGLLLGNPLAPPPVAAEGMSLGYIFLIGLLTSPHCIGMCGGLLLGQSAQSKSPFAAALAYNGGRTVAYTAAGAVFGALGTALRYSEGVRSMVFTMAGLAVVLTGLNLWGLLPGLTAFLPERRGACRLSGGVQKRLAGRPFGIGLLTGLMPCGSLYAMWLYAVSGGSAACGALRMLFFALGTVPLLLLFGGLGALFPRRWNKYLQKARAVLVTAMGLTLLLKGMQMLH